MIDQSEWMQDVYERLVHIESKEDRIVERLDNLELGIVAGDYYRKSYAQYGEDVLIWNLFKLLGIEKPTYIDIGAHHPYEISNTAIFHEGGCHGVNIEANPNLIEAFKKERPNDLNICCGIGAENGEMSFYMIDDKSGRNSFKKEKVQQFIDNNPDFSLSEIKTIKMRTLQEVVDEIGYMPDYMSIDIEGLEYEALSKYNMRENGPKVVTLEIMRGDEGNARKIITLLEGAGYFIYIKIGPNMTFVRNSFKETVYSVG